PASESSPAFSSPGRPSPVGTSRRPCSRSARRAVLRWASSRHRHPALARGSATSRLGLGEPREPSAASRGITRPMPITRLNHAVLYVRDVAVSVAFYREALSFTVVKEVPGAAFLQAPASTNDHDIGLFEIGAQAGASGAGRTTVGLYHLA